MRNVKRTVSLAMLVLAVSALPAIAAGAPKPVVRGSAPSSAFAPSNGCGCHAQLMEQWAKSMHAQAITDPVYRVKRDQGDKATGGTLGAFCDTCHAPVGTMSGEVGTKNMSAASADSVGCSFCHQVVDLKTGPPGNTSHLVETDGVRRAQLKEPRAPHPAAFSGLQTRAEICGGCHNVNHPVNGMHLESTYSEWKAGPYAEEGVVCQDCHMTRDPAGRGPYSGTAAAGGPQRDNLYAMTFVGANVVLGPAEDARARLKSAATLDLEAPDIVKAGEEATISVTITNSGAGHYLPTGLTEVREMWLEVYAEGEGGKKTEIGKRVFGTVLKDAAGKYPVELWDAVAIQSDDRIPPRTSTTSSYAFTMPATAEKTEITAVLKYRSMSDELAEKAGVENVTTEMAVATQPVFSSDEAKATPAKSERSESSSSGWLPAIFVAVGISVVAVLGYVAVKARRR